MPSMTDYSFGDVVLVQFPFTDQSSTKQRPAIVISLERYNTERPDLIILAVTSRMRETLGYAEHLLSHLERRGVAQTLGMLAVASWPACTASKPFLTDACPVCMASSGLRPKASTIVNRPVKG